MKKLFFLSFCILFLASCGENEKKSAQDLLKKAEYSVQNKKFNTAKLQIDSINNKYPAEIETRQAANLLFTQIELMECERDLTYFSQSYKKKKTSLDSLFKYFSIEKSSKFQYYGEYVPKIMTNEKNAGNTYLKVHVLEDGRMYLSCIYCGYEDYVYQSLKISCNGFFIESPSYNIHQSRNYAFYDGIYHWRTIILKEKESKDIVRFIENYAFEKVKVSLLGNWDYSYILNDKNKQAVKDACYLATLIQETTELSKEITKTEKQIFITKIKRDRQQ